MEYKIGSLTPGKQADILLVRADTLALAPLNNPVGQIVYAAHPGLVDTILVAGKIVKRSGVLSGDLLKRACRLAGEHRDSLFERACRTETLAQARPGGDWQPAPLAAEA